MGYVQIIEVRQTVAYRRWFDRLRDQRALALILVRLRRVSLGHPGDARSVGGGVHELLLAGGTKQGQQRDIQRAIRLAQAIGDE